MRTETDDIAVMTRATPPGGRPTLRSMRLLRWLSRRDQLRAERPGLEWRETTLPPASLRGPDGDGLIIQIKQMTIWSRDYSGGHFAHGDVTTVDRGVERLHENVLMWTMEPDSLVGVLHRSLSHPKADVTVSMFDDGMTLRIEGHGADQWRVHCQPVPMPGPDATWETFPVFDFTLTRLTIETAISELRALSAVLTPPQRHPLP